MQPLSAIDAISPAWDHTRKLLLSPMRWQTLLKIGVVAFFAGAGGGSFSSGNGSGFHPGSSGGSSPHWPAMHLPALAAIASLIVVIGVVLLILWFAFFYLSSRLQFVLFDVVLRRDTTIGPIWSRFGPATWRWMGLKLLLSLAALLVLLPVLIPIVTGVIHAISQGHAAPANFAALLAGLFASFALIFLVVIVLSLCSLLLYCFGLPSMALEATPLRETFARVLRLVRAEPLQVFIFVVMRIVLQIAFAIGIGIAFFLGALVLLIPFGAIGGILWALLHSGPTAVKVFMGLGIAILAIVYAAIVLAAGLMCSSVVGTFFQAYSLYFLGGRYPLLGEILHPTPLPPPQGAFYPPAFNPAPPPEPSAL